MICNHTLIGLCLFVCLYISVGQCHDSARRPRRLSTVVKIWVRTFFVRNVQSGKDFELILTVKWKLDTPKVENCVLYLNAECCFVSRHTKHIHWSQLNHPSFTQESAVCTKQNLRSTLPSVTTHSSALITDSFTKYKKLP